MVSTCIYERISALSPVSAAAMAEDRISHVCTGKAPTFLAMHRCRPNDVVHLALREICANVESKRSGQEL